MLEYKLVGIFNENNDKDKVVLESLKKQVEEINKQLDSQDRNIVLVQATPENTRDILKMGSINGVVYSTDIHMNDIYQENFEQIISSAKGIDVYPTNHEHGEKETEHDFSKNEEKNIKSINKETNVFPSVIANEENEAKAFTNILNLGVNSRLDKASKVTENTNKSIQNLMQYVEESIEKKHDYTAGHVDRVSKYAVAVAKEMGYTDEKLEQLEMSARLHDIGKLGIADKILKSDQILTAQERDEMSYHTDLGPEILKCVVKNNPSLGKKITKDVIEGVGQHHKTWDGYKGKWHDKDEIPEEPNHDNINEFALVIAVADCLDTMTSQRAYNVPKNITETFKDLWGNRDRMFRDDIAEKAIVVLGKELATIGLDVSKLLPEDDKDKELKEFLETNKDNFKVKEPVEKEYTSLGFKLDEKKGVLVYEEGTPVYDRQGSIDREVDFWANKKIKNILEEDKELTEEQKQEIFEKEKVIQKEVFENKDKDFQQAYMRMTGQKEFTDKENISEHKGIHSVKKEIPKSTKEKNIKTTEVKESTDVTKEGILGKNEKQSEIDFGEK